MYFWKQVIKEMAFVKSIWEIYEQDPNISFYQDEKLTRV